MFVCVDDYRLDILKFSLNLLQESSHVFFDCPSCIPIHMRDMNAGLVSVRERYFQSISRSNYTNGSPISDNNDFFVSFETFDKRIQFGSPLD